LDGIFDKTLSLVKQKVGFWTTYSMYPYINTEQNRAIHRFVRRLIGIRKEGVLKIKFKYNVHSMTSSRQVPKNATVTDAFSIEPIWASLNTTRHRLQEPVRVPALL